MIQIRLTKDDLTAKGLLILLAHTSGLQALACLEGCVPRVPAGSGRIVGKCIGDYVPIEVGCRRELLKPVAFPRLTRA